MRKLTQLDLWLLEVIGVDKWTIAELYRFASSKGVNLVKLDRSIEKMIAQQKLKLENKKYFAPTSK